MGETPMQSLLGQGDMPTECKVVTEDVSMHWFPSFEPGSPCFCGERTYTPEPVETEGDSDIAMGDQGWGG